MAAYVHANIEVTDPAAYEEYRRQVAATVQAHGGRFLARGGAVEQLEGAELAPRHVIIEFPDMETLKAWYGSSEYQPLAKLRQRASRGTLVAIHGV